MHRRLHVTRQILLANSRFTHDRKGSALRIAHDISLHVRTQRARIFLRQTQPTPAAHELHVKCCYIFSSLISFVCQLELDVCPRRTKQDASQFLSLLDINDNISPDISTRRWCRRETKGVGGRARDRVCERECVWQGVGRVRGRCPVTADD